MFSQAIRWKWAVLPVGVAVAVGLAGCGRSGAGPAPAGSPAAAVTPTETKAEAPPSGEKRWQQPFAEATLAEPPTEHQQLPPDTTRTGKSVGKLYTEVVRQWDQVRFQAAGGKWLAYTVTLETEMGPIEIALRPDLAPNQVRSFVALVRAGYYDGLVFERVVREESDAQPGSRLELIEAGCPLGTGDPGCGSIGYWMKPEISPQATHEEGTVGAYHDEEQPDTAACKFYITLSKAPVMDGHFTVFGRVTRGLDVARRINSQPTRNDAANPGGDRPIHPVVIRKATVQSQEVGELK